MEPWQVSHIQRNQYNLQKLTICNSSFRAVLQQHGVLGVNDISQLDAVGNSKGKLAESELLYSLLVTRERAFQALIDACDITQQTGALRVLKQVHISKSTIWNELSEELKNELGSKLVGFQGNKVKFSECCNHLHHLIDGEFLEQLEKGNTPTLVNNQVPDQVEYYIHRTLRSRSKLKSSVFQQPCNDIFVVEGMEKYQLTNLVAGAETDVSGNQINGLTVRFILLECDRDFETICKLTSSPVHFIRYKNEVYEWVSSSGSVKTLQKHVDDAQDCFPEGELAARGNRVNVIPDSPGMGKTLLLANVAYQISKEKPNTLIRFLLMKEVVDVLSKKPITLESVTCLIVEQSSDFKCGQELVKHILKSEPSILMLDGFDEVLLNQIDIAKEILKTIATLKSVQVFVTTRPHMRDELENTLNVLGYTINPFTESDQVDFLLKFWKMKGVAKNETLKQFATECVNTISSNMTDFERDIAGIPLQCRLLAETYTMQAVRCSQIGFQNIKFQSIGQINSIFEMYERHIIMRLDNWKVNVEAIKHFHMYYALELLFPDNAHQFQELKTASVSVNELCVLGFFEVSNSDDIRFVHRTFAEFFVAWFAVEMKTSGNISSFILNELLATKEREREFLNTPVGKTGIGTSFTFNYPVIAYFINGFGKMISKQYGNEEQSRLVSMLMDSVYYKQVSRIFLASAVSDYQFVPFTVSLCFGPLQISENVISVSWDLLFISAKYSSAALMKIFCFHRDLTNLKSEPKVDQFELTPLHVAVKRGNYHLVAFLAQKYERKVKNLRYLLHFCVFESLTENEEIIKDKVQIIKLLSMKYIVWLDETLDDGKVPLLQKDVNCELIKCLIECGADVNVFDSCGESILYKITQNPVKPEFYHWLVVSLSERKFKYFNPHIRFEGSPLHCAVEKVDLLAETLKYFKINSADFNAEDMIQSTPLFYAIRGGRSVSLMCTLIELGADWKKENIVKQTVLHICAENGHYHAMQYFLETYKMDVNAKDATFRTPLHYAVTKRTKDQELVQQLLICRGADVNADDDEQPRHTKLSMTNRLGRVLQVKYFTPCSDGTPFMKALRDGEGLTLSTIKLMEKHGLSITAKRASKALEYFLCNRNITSWEIDEEFVQVHEFLIGKGGMIQDVPVVQGSTEYTTIWKSNGVQNNIRTIIQSSDMSFLWPHLKTSGLLTKSELKDIQNVSTDSLHKCERFYELVQSKKGSFERVCNLLRASKQMGPLALLRKSLYSALTSYQRMFVTPPTFTNQFLHSQHNFSLNAMALVTINPFLTTLRISDTVSNNMVVIKEANISSDLKKTEHDDLIIVIVRVLTAKLISRLEENRAVQGKIFFVCSAVTENVENCHVVTDSLSTWDDISTQYFKSRAKLHLLDNRWIPIFELFENPLIFNNISQFSYMFNKFPQNYYSVLRFKVGHIDKEFQLKSYLCHSIFHYVLPDKTVFLGISIEKLKEFARFGHKIGYFGEDDVDHLDFLVIEQSQQFYEICLQTSENVHLVEYEQEKGAFKLVKTFGWDERIRRFLKQQLCEGFPHCDCAPGKESVVVNFLIKTSDYFVTHRFECILPINELTPKTMKITKLEDAEELFNLRALLKRMCGEPNQVKRTDFIDQSHGEQIVHLVTEHLSTLLVENKLHHVAINTLFPNLAEQTNIITGLEKYQQLGMLEQVDKHRIVFVNKSLAWYFIAKLLMGLPETPGYEGITGALRKEVLQNCFEYQNVQLKSRYQTIFPVCINSPKYELKSYKFTNIMCFRFMEVLLNNSRDMKDVSFSNFLLSILTTKPVGHKWIHACVNANLFQLLHLIISFKIDATSSELKSAELFVLAVNYADVPITRLVAERFKKKTNRKLTEIKVYLNYEEISLVHLAALRGNYGLMKYLFNDQGFSNRFQRRRRTTQDKLEEAILVINYWVEDTAHISSCAMNERKRIIDLLLQTDVIEFKQIGLYSENIHLDLILYLVSLGVDIYGKDARKSSILHHCPEYLTPQEYHKVVSIIHAKNSTSIARLFKEINSDGKTAFHVAVEHLELLDETLALFSEAGVNFNALTRDGDSVFIHAARHKRSARLWDALYRSGADIHTKDGQGQSASDYCQTALRYLSSRGVGTRPVVIESNKYNQTS